MPLRPTRRQMTTTMTTKKPPQSHPAQAQEDNKKRHSGSLSLWIRRHPARVVLWGFVVVSVCLRWLQQQPVLPLPSTITAASRKNTDTTSPTTTKQPPRKKKKREEDNDGEPPYDELTTMQHLRRNDDDATQPRVAIGDDDDDGKPPENEEEDAADPMSIQEEKDANDASSRDKVPKPLAQNLQMEPVLFVHVGKAGGTTIHDMNKKAYKLCKEKDKLPSNTSTPYSCTLSRMTPSKRVHIWHRQDSYPNYSQFLVTVRNPIDRLVSWFYYSRTHRTTKPTTASTTMHSCYNTINDLVTATMLPNTNLTGNEDYPPYFHNTTNNCVEVGRKCLLGEKNCKQHNFYNNEVYMEDLVYWKSCYNKLNQQPQIADHNDNGQDHCVARNIRIDVIRQEYAEFDLFHVLKLWGVPPNITPETGFNYKAKNILAMKTTSSRSKNKTLEVSPSKYISPEGVRALCEAICPELLAYKSVVANADNLNSSDVVNAFQDLDDSCHVLVDEICGTEFHYRNYKQLKKFQIEHVQTRDGFI